MTTISDVLYKQVAARPDTIALIDARQNLALSFAELDKAARRVEQALTVAGLTSGDRVLLFQPMSAVLYVVLMALFRQGMVAMFVDPSAGKGHLERCCAIAPPQAFIASPKAQMLRLVSPPLRQIPTAFVTVGTQIRRLRIPALSLSGKSTVSSPIRPSKNPPIAPATIDAGHPALLTFTSGSTGKPKAALRTHAFLLAQHNTLAHSLSLQAEAIDLTTLPIFVLANLASGVTSLIPDADLRFPGKIKAGTVMRQIHRYQPQSTAASPAFLERLAEYCEETSQSLPSFQRIFSGGAPVFPFLLERLQRLAPQATVTAVYGSTEAEPIAHIAYSDIAAGDRTAMSQGKGLLAGKPVPEIQLRILQHPLKAPIPPLYQAEFDAKCSPPDTIGEIVVSGNHVLSGYLDGEGDAETKFRVAGVPWHRTGDAGYQDAQGRIWLLGRCAARIDDERGRIYPFAVEAAAQSFPNVRRTALANHGGKRILLVEWNGDARDPDALKQALSWAKLDQVRSHPIPLDRRHNAKVDYPALEQLLEDLD
ncbi:MAG: AMP-binding protein [Cyanobacteria bacterium J06638_20]